MPTGNATPSRFLAEWYTPHLRSRAINDIAAHLQHWLDAIPDQHRRPQLMYAVEIPEDAYAFGVFAADSADLVLQACQDAGLPASRVSAAIEATLTDTTSD